MTYKSIAEEAADCRVAFSGTKVGDWVWFCHHGVVAEQLTEPAETRIAYILSDKTDEEQAIRLRWFRPVKSKAVAPADAAYDKAVATAYSAYNKAVAPARAACYKAVATALKKELPGCPWDGTTLFRKGDKG